MVLDEMSMNWFRLRERRSSLQTQSKLALTASRSPLCQAVVRRPPLSNH
jgi:hypothetical protein